MIRPRRGLEDVTGARTSGGCGAGVGWRAEVGFMVGLTGGETLRQAERGGG